MSITEYLGRVPLAAALGRQDEVAAAVRAGEAGRVLGFESDPVVTLGLRGTDADLKVGPDALAGRGFDVVRVDRGGQATLHNPGQLVIFPVWPLGSRGTRAWVDVLITVTRDLASAHGQDLWWREDAPGLYTPAGAKVVALGLRVRRGVSTHGLAINVRNELADFGLIRACGQVASPVAHLATSAALDEVFAEWSRRFVTRVSLD